MGGLPERVVDARRGAIFVGKAPVDGGRGRVRRPRCSGLLFDRGSVVGRRRARRDTRSARRRDDCDQSVVGLGGPRRTRPPDPPPPARHGGSAVSIDRVRNGSRPVRASPRPRRSRVGLCCAFASTGQAGCLHELVTPEFLIGAPLDPAREWPRSPRASGTARGALRPTALPGARRRSGRAVRSRRPTPGPSSGTRRRRSTSTRGNGERHTPRASAHDRETAPVLAPRDPRGPGAEPSPHSSVET
ncbi:hypothetical protein DB32_002184 [Sandaracinus amylolyticus]|uniref:Uncharacterized protein n=1 Tax=Sandaracinus amylolyticus TaxID=927083 RepID=A0A0F6YIE7_9BACT|nr:hypothetical protein DB32_002184 [Sandaracinus amylolyticus]